MEFSQTLKISAPISPYNSNDVHPTHLAEFGKGGYRTVSSINARNAIPLERREMGMAVFVNDADQKLYILKGGLEDTNWVDFSQVAQGEGASTIYVSDTPPDTIDEKTIWLNPLNGFIQFRDPLNTTWVDLGVKEIDCGTF